MARCASEDGRPYRYHIPSNAYLVYGNSDQIADVQALAATAPFVQWEGAFLDDYKIDAAVIIPGRNAPANAAVQDLFAIQLVADAQANRDTLTVINQLKSGPIVHQYEMSEYLNVFVYLPPAAIPQIAARPEIVSIQMYVLPTLLDERQDQIVAGNITGNSPSAPGYLSFLTAQGFTQAQFSASNFAVDMSDSGIDNGTTSPNHFGLFVNGTRPGTSRVIYNRLVGTPHPGSTL